MLLITGMLRHVLRMLGYGTVGIVLGLLTAFVLYLDSRPDLQPWHLVQLDEEFTADSGVADFDAYLALEDRLFRQLDARVDQGMAGGRPTSIDRYTPGSLADPNRWPRNWNRSFVLSTDSPSMGVLLLHGMSDSPYSLRALGERLHAAGAYVIGVRMPGHGTLPSGLVELTWQDMAAAVRLAMQELARRTGDRPLHIVGYSTGAALAVHNVLESLDDSARPRVSRLVMLSPAIGVSSAAAYAVWQARLGHLLGLDKLAWSDLLPEYDPFKYNSFAVNAGDVVYRLTSEIQRLIAELESQGRLEALPPILAFSSVVDATVSTPALVSGLFTHLPRAGHELVLFDINREIDLDHLQAWKPDAVLDALKSDSTRDYRLSVVTNQSRNSQAVHLLTLGPNEREARAEALDLAWPRDIYSLAHVALPFPPGDPLYGIAPRLGDPETPRMNLGNLALRGERGVLQVGASAMLRLRSNPFFPFVWNRIEAFLSLGDQ